MTYKQDQVLGFRINETEVCGCSVDIYTFLQNMFYPRKLKQNIYAVIQKTVL